MATSPVPLKRAAYSPEEAIFMLGVSRAKLYEMINAGQLRSVKIGRRRFIPASAIDALFTEDGQAA